MEDLAAKLLATHVILQDIIFDIIFDIIIDNNKLSDIIIDIIWPQVSNLVCDQGKKIALLKIQVRTLFCKTRGADFSQQLPFALLAVPFGQ